mgnify:CR=1 FL=1
MGQESEQPHPCPGPTGPPQVGDGLVAQIPSLVLSLATAIVVTRVTTSESMTDQTTGQLANPGALFITAGILTLLGIIPGMPSMVFIMLAAICAAIGYLVYRSNPRSDDSEAEVSLDSGVQATEEQEGLRTELKELLDELTYNAMMTGDAEKVEQVNNIKKKIPLSIFVF